jgi:hypothetical protein
MVHLKFPYKGKRKPALVLRMTFLVSSKLQNTSSASAVHRQGGLYARLEGDEPAPTTDGVISSDLSAEGRWGKGGSEKSDQVILSRAKDLVILSGSLVSLETMLCIRFLPVACPERSRRVEMTQETASTDEPANGLTVLINP